ncbi:MAG: glycosyltransferase family 2 protein [Gammaproteobacteria bacterium]
MTELLLITLTVSSIFLVVYHHLGYPLILRWVKKHNAQRSIHINNRQYFSSSKDVELPTISIVVPAYNEQRWITDKIRNLAILDYPSDRITFIIACDGCTDDTATIARRVTEEPECRHMNIEIHDFEKNRGKVAVINDVLENISTDLVALSDVSALISIDSLLITAEHFKNPDIGVLNGHYRLLNPGSTGEAAYWRYQSKIKSSEAALGSTLGSHGAFYVFRRALFEPLAPDTINDDFVLPMKIVAAGYRADYEDAINTIELEKADDTQDHQRRRRIAAGNCQQLLRLKQLLLPRYGGVAFAFLSGKGLRVLMPFLMIIALSGSLILSLNFTLFAILASAQVFAYLLAAWQLLFQPKRTHHIIQTLAYLVGGHTAGFIGTIRYLSGLERGRWKRIESTITQ